ncbi:hypothetical protein LTR02_008051 [Friedmanniomyces endolithicus]|nr:hypothetical protein LTR02_008051 [Friedmanniomyces endolithicus]
MDVTGARIDVTPRSPPFVVEVEGTQVPPTSIEDASHRIVETTGKIVWTGARTDVTPRSPPFVVEVEGTQVPLTRIEDTSHRIVETTGKIVWTGARTDVTPRSPPPAVLVGEEAATAVALLVAGTQVPLTRIEETSHRIVETTGKIVWTGATWR